MEKDDLLKDDFLKNLIGKSRLEEPSDQFVGNVMEQIRLQPQLLPAKKPFFLNIRAILGYSLLGLAVIIFLFTSDIPLTNWIPGKDYLANNYLLYFSSFFSGWKHLFSEGKSLSIPIMVLLSAGLLFLFDRFILHRILFKQSQPA